MYVNRFIGLFLLLLTLATSTFAQKKTRYSLEKERKEIKNKIKEANQLLAATQNEKKNSEGQLRALNQRIYTQERYLGSLKNEVSLINKEMGDMEDIIFSLQRDLDSLKKEYGDMVYATYKANNSFNNLSFLFTSNSYNQLMMRIKYLDQFRRARRKQLEKIEQLKAYLIDKEDDLKGKLKEKQDVLLSFKNQSNELLTLRTKQKNMVNTLASREGEFRKKIQKYEQDQVKLDKLIKDIIAKEIAKAKKPTASGSASNRLKTTKESTLISKNFVANKGRIPWPLTKCFVSRRFGKQPHSVLKDVYTMNNGLGLQCEKGSNVKTVFDGTVTTVATIPGLNKVIMVKHGDYFTVYAKMKNVTVKTGDKVTAKTIIGTVDTSNDGDTELEFQIWNGKEKLNPQSWLAR